ncbi:hypothetical protein F4X73_05120 [Candidatus Poribacteria bacterium]|nr:hypothetical protein [Candidatus Poribacteria bacterium]MYB64049.1 hypothetical protein [Candidatus Poribacteria bacterium]MYF55594.1 hypothetical protein [Candidatus Poribacteria bacterium]
MHQNEHSAIRDVAKPSRLRFVVGTLIFGSILIILTCYWIISAENRVVWELTDFSIFPTVLFTFFLLAAITPLLRKYLKNIAPTSRELAMTYIMVSVATALAGHDIVRQLVPMIANAGWFATPENEWSDIFFRFLPTWLTITDRKILQGYFEGDDTFWRPIYMEAWFVPIVAWSALVIVLLFMMLCINIIIRKQWIDHEKLSYPLTTLPVELLGNTSNLFRNKLIWLGFGIAFGLELLAGLNYLFPVIPSLKIKYQLFFADRPWNAMGRLPVYVYPFAIGLGYLMPLDLALSFWAFYLFWGLQRVFFSATGWTTAIGFQTEQRAGAWIGIGLLALLTSRREILKVLGGVFSFRSKDPLYRLAVFGLLFGLAFVLIFWYYAGLSPWVALGYFGIYLILCIGMTRMRAELGPPTHELHRVHPDRIMLLFLGSRPLGAQNLTNTTLLSWLAYGYRCHPMPHQLEAFKIGRHFSLRENRLVVALIVASIVGAVISIVGHVALYYEFRFARWGVGEFNRLQNWITSPRAPNLPAIQYIGFGFVFTVILTVLKRQFLWWPFYPVGYAVGNGWAIGWMWFSIFLGWLFKRILFTGGGVRAYRRALPLFLGLIFGQFLAGSLWSLLGVLFNTNMYTLFP